MNKQQIIEEMAAEYAAMKDVAERTLAALQYNNYALEYVEKNILSKNAQWMELCAQALAMGIKDGWHGNYYVSRDYNTYRSVTREFHRVVMVGRHEMTLPEDLFEIVERVDVDYSINPIEASRQFASIVKDAESKGCAVYIQNVPAQLAFGLLEQKMPRDEYGGFDMPLMFTGVNINRAPEGARPTFELGLIYQVATGRVVWAA